MKTKLLIKRIKFPENKIEIQDEQKDTSESRKSLQILFVHLAKTQKIV